MPRRSMEEKQHVGQMVSTLEDVQLGISILRRTRDIVPEGWLSVHRETPCKPAKKRITLRMDADVLDWYHSLGRGYQARMNAVLKAYMHSILSKHIEQGDDFDWLNMGQ